MFTLSRIDKFYALLPYIDGRPFFHGPCDLLRLRQTTNKARKIYIYLVTDTYYLI